MASRPFGHYTPRTELAQLPNCWILGRYGSMETWRKPHSYTRPRADCDLLKCPRYPRNPPADIDSCALQPRCCFLTSSSQAQRMQINPSSSLLAPECHQAPNLKFRPCAVFGCRGYVVLRCCGQPGASC